MDHHETTAANIARAWVGDRKREADRDCRIDGIAAAVENFDADPRGAAFLCDYDAVSGMDRLRRWNIGWARDRRDLG
jgi:hypothetical protein